MFEQNAYVLEFNSKSKVNLSVKIWLKDKLTLMELFEGVLVWVVQILFCLYEIHAYIHAVHREYT